MRASKNAGTLLAVAAMMVMGSPIMQGQPKVTYSLDAATQAGLEVVTQQNRSFGEELAAIKAHPNSRASRIGEIGPLVVILKNTSGQPIDSVVVKYEYHFLDGVVRSGPISLAANPMNVGQFAPGQTLTFHPYGQHFGSGFVGLEDTDADKLLALMNRCSQIVVSVDSVVFADGRLVGADSMGTMAQRQAFAKAGVDVEIELVSLNGDLDQIKAFAAGLAATRLPVMASSEGGLRDFGFQYASMRLFLGRIILTQPERAREVVRQFRAGVRIDVRSGDTR